MSPVAVVYVLLYYAYKTSVCEYEVQYNIVFTVETYSKNKSYETCQSEFRSRFLGISVRSKTTASTGENLELAFCCRRSERELNMFSQKKRWITRILEYV
jgi:hypothetical protein